MDIKMSDLQKHLEEEMQNAEFAAEYDALDAHYAFARQIIRYRIEQGITQGELAKQVGTSQANISKIEHGTLNPTFEMAQRIAAGLGKRLNISLQ